MPLSAKTVEKALRAANGNVSVAARALDKGRSTVNRVIAEHSELQAVLIEARAEGVEVALDEAEEALAELRRDRHWAAVKYSLDNLGARRGYGDAAAQARLDAMEKRIGELMTLLAAQGTLKPLHGEDGNAQPVGVVGTGGGPRPGGGGSEHGGPKAPGGDGSPPGGDRGQGGNGHR